MSVLVLCGGGGVRRSQPIARAFVPRWVLMGGISTDRCLVVPASW